MFDHQTKKWRHRPAARFRKKFRTVQISVPGGTYDLEPGEAMAFANRLVDAAEKAERLREA